MPQVRGRADSAFDRGTSGKFWGCSNYRNGCRVTYPDKNGKPDTGAKPAAKKQHQASPLRELQQIRFCTMTLVKQIRFAVPAAAAIGAAAWAGTWPDWAWLPSLWLCGHPRTRRTAAWLVMLAYYMAVARGLPIGAAKFFGGDRAALFAVSLWLGASLALSLPWALLWSTQRTGYYWRIPVAVILCVIPPIGLVGWGNPVLAAGDIFPSYGLGRCDCYGPGTGCHRLCPLAHWRGPGRVWPGRADVHGHTGCTGVDRGERHKLWRGWGRRGATSCATLQQTSK